MLKYFWDAEAGKLLPGKGAKSTELTVELMQPAEFRALQGAYPHKKNLDRSLDHIQYCKVETFGDCVQGTMKIPEKGTDDFFRFGFYLHANQLILTGGGAFLQNLLEQMSLNAYGKCSLNQFLLILFELIIEDDVLYLQQLEEKLSDMEEELLRNLSNRFYETVIQNRKKLSTLHAYYEQLINIGDLMQENLYQSLTAEDCAGWRHYTGRVERLHNHAEMLREYMLQIRELYQSQIDVQQNRVMSFLTIVTTIFLPLTLIVGWYGMNFPNMPELKWPLGYPVVILVSIVIVALEILYLKRRKML
ncbi:MAG: CorA family divalent cation transporter [Intestinibacillus sp.]